MNCCKNVTETDLNTQTVKIKMIIFWGGVFVRNYCLQMPGQDVPGMNMLLKSWSVLWMLTVCLDNNDLQWLGVDLMQMTKG